MRQMKRDRNTEKIKHNLMSTTHAIDRQVSKLDESFNGQKGQQISSSRKRP